MNLLWPCCQAGRRGTFKKYSNIQTASLTNRARRRLGRIEPYYRTYVAKLLYMAKRVKPEMLGAVSVPGYKGP